MRQWFCVLVGLSLVAGCGGDAGTSVSGSVTYEGVPVVKGQITFTPQDGKGPIVGGEIVGGQYSVTDLVPGQKIVQITAVEEPAGPLSSADMAQAAQSGKSAASAPKVIVPDNATGNGQTIDIKPGSQKQDFTLTKPAGR